MKREQQNWWKCLFLKASLVGVFHQKKCIEPYVDRNHDLHAIVKQKLDPVDD